MDMQVQEQSDLTRPLAGRVAVVTEVDELSALAVFLCGPDGRLITGTALPVDGGWTTH